MDDTVGEVLLACNRSYAAALRPVLGEVHALAHITGAGFRESGARVAGRCGCHRRRRQLAVAAAVVVY